jgi:hypothetical protein
MGSPWVWAVATWRTDNESTCPLPAVLHDPDLLLEIVDRLPEFLAEAMSQTRYYRQPQVSFHNPQRIMGQWAAGKGYRQIVSQVTTMKKLTLGQYSHHTPLSGKWREEPRPEPDLGNPTFRDRRETCGNVGYGDG